MRLHCSWTVLVTIVWTILLDGSATEPNEEESRNEVLENSGNEYKKSWSRNHQQNVNTTDGGSPERSKDESRYLLDTTNSQIIPKDEVVENITVIKTEIPPMTDYTLSDVTVPTTISFDSTERSKTLLETGNYNNNDNNVPGTLQTNIHQVASIQNACDLISSKKASTVSYGTNDDKNFSKTTMSRSTETQKTIDAKVDDQITMENRIPRAEIRHAKRASKLTTVTQSSAAYTQLISHNSQSDEKENPQSHSLISPTTEYSTNKAELPSLSSSSVDSPTDGRISIDKNLRSSSWNNDDKNVPSTDTRGSVTVSSIKAIDPGNHIKKGESQEDDRRNIARTLHNVTARALGRSIGDRSIANTRKLHLQRRISNANKMEERKAANTNMDVTDLSSEKKSHAGRFESTNFFVKAKNFQREKTNPVIIISPREDDHKNTPSASSHTDFHIIFTPTEISPGLSDKRTSEASTPPAPDGRHVDPSFSTGNPVQDFKQSLIRNSAESSLYTRIFSKKLQHPPKLLVDMKDTHEKLQNLQEINYPKNEKNKRKFYFAYGLSRTNETNSENVVVSSGNNAVESKVPRGGRFGGSTNNVERIKATGMQGETGRSNNHRETVSTTVNPDIAKESGIHRSVVKNTAYTGSQMKNKGHQILVAQVAGSRINLPRQQLKDQGRKKQEQTFLAEMDSLERDGSFAVENGAATLENSKGFSLAVEVQRGNKIFNSISTVTPKRTRKMPFSKSELDGTRASRKGKANREGLVIAAAATMETLQYQRSPQTGDEYVENNIQGIKDTETNLKNFIVKNDHPIGTNTFSSIHSPFPDPHSQNVGSDNHRDDEEIGCNDKSQTTQAFRRQRCRVQSSETISHRVEGAPAMLEESGDAYVDTKITSDVDSVTVTPDSQRKRKRWKGKMADSIITTETHFSTLGTPLSILLRGRYDEITDDTRANSAIEKNVKEDRNDRENKMLSRRTNNIRKIDIDESSGPSMAIRLKLRDSTTVNDDALEIRTKMRNHMAGESSTVETCKTKKNPVIAENTTISYDKYSNGGGSGHEQSGNENGDGIEKIQPSISVFQELKARAKITTQSDISSVLEASDIDSLPHSSAEFKLTDRLGPEPHDQRRMNQENIGILVDAREPTFIKPEARSTTPSGKEVNHQPLSPRKISGDGNLPLDLALHPPNENTNNGSLFGLNLPDSSFPAKSKAHEELQHGSLISGFSDSFVQTMSDDEITNNAGSVPSGYGNFSRYAALQARSLSTGGRRRKSVGRKESTESSTSSTKTDSTWPIDGPQYHGVYPARKVLLSHSQSGVLATTHQTERLPHDTFAEQIKGGFTTAKSTSIYVTPTTSRRSYDYASSINVAAPEVRDIKSPVTIIRTSEGIVSDFEPSSTYPGIIETTQPSKSIEILPRKIASAPVVEVSNENPMILDADNNNSILVKAFEQEKSSMMGEQESANLQLWRSKQPPENVAIVIGAGNAQTFNSTASDNSTRIATTLNQWPVKYSAVVEGDLVLGGLMMVHEREDSITCGPVMPQGGVQALEAMLYTLDWVNKRDLVPGVKIGAHILDDCDKDTYGLEMAVDFIKGSISNIDGAEYHCNKTAVRKVISGVVGAASSVTSIQVANLLRLFRIPQVSFFSTSPELSNKMRFEYFTRTIPSDHYQVKAMVDIVLAMNWSYVSIIYEESNYGEKAYEELEKLLGKHQICIAVKEKLSKDSGVAKAHVYDNIVQKLLTKPRARGCIIFASDQEVAGVMKAVRRCNATGAFSWIGSDGWSARSLVSDGNEPEMEGTLSVQPQANPVEGFEDYFLNLTVENNRRNPWFVEFWENHFKCRYPNASQTPYNNYTKECTTTESLTKQNTAFENQLQFVSDAVMAFAYAFRNMHAKLCHGNRGLCDAMKPTKGTELLSYLKTVQFKGLSGDVFHFDKNGDGPARYNIIHFKQVSPGKYKWIRVGKYLEGELRLNMSEIQFRLGHPEPPESVCSLPCEVGQAKKYVEGESCCWHCFNCTQYQIRHESDEKQCVQCPQGTVPDETHSYCRDIPENFLRPESGWAIGAMSFSSTGILVTLFVGGVFWKHNDTPIVRASGRELSYILLTGILLCYLVTFALVLRPNDIVCGIQRFSAGFCFTVVYAALLTKTNRISRIFNAGKHSAKRPSFISPRSQLIICSMLVGVQILINGVWMVIDPAKAMHHYPTREDNLLVCNSYINASYMIAFTYPIILIVVCTVYAVLTRKIPEAFNESKHIGFTMYTTCVIWLAFVPLCFATGSQVALRITSMSVTISLSASVTIACLFTPKLYIILIHPERNVRPNMMMTRYNTTKGSVVTATNASSIIAPVTLTAVTCDQNKAVKKHVIATIDCSTQSEQFEMETTDQKNGKPPAAVVTRSTQTLLNNNGKECDGVTSPVIKDISIDENLPSVKGINLAKIGNGPLNQNELPL